MDPLRIGFGGLNGDDESRQPVTSENISTQLKAKLRQTLERDSSEPLSGERGITLPASVPMRPEKSYHLKRLSRQLREMDLKVVRDPGAKKNLGDTLTEGQSVEGPGKGADRIPGLSAIPRDESSESEAAPKMGPKQESPQQAQMFLNQTISISGGSMQDLSGYKDLSKPPVVAEGEGEEGEQYGGMATGTLTPSVKGLDRPPVFSSEYADSQPDVDTEFSSNVRTLIRLVNDLPEGVTKQTGAQIIRLTMEAMGISMEDVLTEAQSAQSEMLDAVRANIKKIEEYKTVIRKLESDIKYYQGKANELSEIIDLFILSNTSPKVPNVDELTEG